MHKRLEHFIFDQDFIEERRPAIGDTVVLVYAEWTKMQPELGVVVGFTGGRVKVFTPLRMVLWDDAGSMYVVDKNKIFGHT